MADLRFELERRGLSIFTGDELRQLKMDVRKRVEAEYEAKSGEEVKITAKDRVQAVWRNAKPTSPIAEPGEWMTQSQQLVVDGKVLSFDLRVRSEDILIPVPKAPRRRKPAVKKEPVDVVVNSQGESSDTAIILE